ncbi:MAG TPA: hypothetical protein VFF94_04975, partial [Novosphingobium sp.]|nr:hypothetical protein [Novosphingobium sp.]
MTKHRPPLTIDAALARIAGQLPGGWPEMAALLGRRESIVRAWGDPDRRELIPLGCAIQLDLAHQAAGGKGAPLHEVYTLQLQLEHVTRFADGQALTHVLSSVIKEAAEAESAIALSTLPDAG